MRIFIIMIAAFGLQACSSPSLYQEGHLTHARAQVQEDKFYKRIPLDKASQPYLEEIARHYEKHGDGALDLSVVYDPARKSALSASNDAAQIANTLGRSGVSAIESDILPVRGQSSVILEYSFYTAQAPKDCGTIAGYDSTDIKPERDYRLGCTVETLIARQIARPKDLLGQEYASVLTDGRSAASLVNGVRSGTFNEPLGGEIASGN